MHQAGTNEPSAMIPGPFETLDGGPGHTRRRKINELQKGQ